VVYFLDCPEITDVVYPCAEDAPPNTYDTNAWAERQRLLHSWLVGRGALAVAKAIGFKPDLVVLSETPTLFGHPTLVNDALATDPLFADAKTVFNDHTPLEYAHPIWPKEETLELTRMNPAPIPLFEGRTYGHHPNVDRHFRTGRSAWPKNTPA
jgi:hypothetical protein